MLKRIFSVCFLFICIFSLPVVATEKDVKNPKVSVIVPVYNTEKYLEECIDSLLAQTFEDFEGIFVDDGSTDSSPDILRKYSEKDERIRVITQKNSGQGTARNIGIENALGDYLAFMDADDFVERDFLKLQYGKIVSTNSDICICNRRRYNTNTQKYSTLGDIKKSMLPKKDVFSYRDIPDKIFNISTPAIWNKMYRKSFIIENGIKFAATKNEEDQLFGYGALAMAGRITTNNAFLYNYRVGLTNNACSRKVEEKVKSTFIVYKQLKDYLTLNNMYEKVKVCFVNTFSPKVMGHLVNTRSNRDLRLFIFDMLKNKYIKDFAMLSLSRNQYQNKLYYDCISKIVYTEDYVI